MTMRAARYAAAAAIVASLSFVSSAEAATYAKFYTGTTGYGGPFSGAGTVYDNTKSLSTNCPTVGSCSGDNVAASLAFTGLPIIGTASGVTGNKVWDDLSPHFGGVGVGTGSPNDTDQIAGHDVLTLTFTSSVKLTGVGTLFDSAHKPFGHGFSNPSDIKGNIGFLLSVDGGAFNTVSFLDANLMLLNLTGKTFSFEEKSGNPEFYVSALSYEIACGPGIGCSSQGTTPIPAALPLFAGGLGALALVVRRRKRVA